MITVFFVSVLVGVTLFEVSFFVFGGHWFRSQIRKIGANLHDFRDAVGDDARQALLLRSGSMTLKFSLTVLALLVAIAVLAFTAPWLLAWNESQQAEYLIVTSLAATGWWLFRRSRSDLSSMASPTKKAHAYGAFERWLHWLALEPGVVRHLAFDMECQFALPKRCALGSVNETTGPADGAVYVCGLARSGTTMLLRILDEIENFRSLTYRDMPFVLAPNLWRQMSRHAQKTSFVAERAHGDGILVDVDSPEGLEEVFWRTFGKKNLNMDCLDFNEPSQEVLDTFADYRAIVANPRVKYGETNGVLRRYLSKNNNNLLRLRSLCADSTATVLLVYRNPITTARSLYRQHQNFCKSQSDDGFTRAYMGWLAHYEFGLDHRPFCFAVSEMDASLTPDKLDYWLSYWNAVYRYILIQSNLRFHLVNHDALRANPEAMLDAIFTVLRIHADTAALAQQIAAPDVENTDGFSPDLIRRAEVTYRSLLDSSKNIYNFDNSLRP